MTDIPSNPVTRFDITFSRGEAYMSEFEDGGYVLYEALVNENKARVDIAKELARVTDAYYRVLGQLQQVETAGKPVVFGVRSIEYEALRQRFDHARARIRELESALGTPSGESSPSETMRELAAQRPQGSASESPTPSERAGVDGRARQVTQRSSSPLADAIERLRGAGPPPTEPVRFAAETQAEHPPQLMAVVDKWQDYANERGGDRVIETLLAEIRNSIVSAEVTDEPHISAWTDTKTGERGRLCTLCGSELGPESSEKSTGEPS